MSDKTKYSLAIDQCPKHSTFYAVSVDSDAGGTRLTPSKCCGQWKTVRSWELSAREWAEIIEQAQIAKEAAEKS